MRMPVALDLVSGELTIPVAAVAALLRAVAASWTTGPCPTGRRAAAPFAGALVRVADQVDVECIAAAGRAAAQAAGPTG
ncbi:hypothetical protein ACFVVU_09175 [Kitasatospora sp. NPDC057965]|uniref:hypothetical protein n=1 Tax=Kitasatospora sp. NPDC057965 TaxID=3346291 RepID=UPI0036DD0BE6